MHPNSTKTMLFLSLLKVVKFLYPKGKIYRVEEIIKLMTRPLNSNSNKIRFVYPDITHKPWYESHDYDTLNFVSETLKKGLYDIENECLSYLSSVWA